MRDVRRDYGQGAPIEIDDPSKPLELLSKWVQDAIDAGVTEPNAMNIATVDARGNPRNRMVLLKHLEGDDIGFFTNLESDKSVEIQGHSMVSATIWWPEMERQVRIEGLATQMDRGLAEDYHSSRPRKSRLAAWASDQSRPLGSREELEGGSSSTNLSSTARTSRSRPSGGLHNTSGQGRVLGRKAKQDA